MKIANKLIALILVLALSVCFFASCGGDAPVGTEGTPSDSSNVNEGASNSDTESNIEAEPPITDISLIENKEFVFSVIISSDSKIASREAMYELINSLYSNLGIVTKFKNDNTEASTNEILIGITNRPESSAAKEGLKKDDYVVKYVRETGNIVIAGGSNDAVVEAVKYFVSNFIDKENKTFAISTDLDYAYRTLYEISNVTIDGIPLDDYVIVVPENADLYTYYAGVNLSDWIAKKAGIIIDVVEDSALETQYEILVGNTNRSESQNTLSVAINDGEFLLKKDGSKIVMRGNTYMVGGAASEFANNYLVVETKGASIALDNLPTANTTKKFEFKEAKNAILMIGDGMGFPHIQWTIDDKVIDHFVARDLPVQGQTITSTQSVIDGTKAYPDSAATATAYSTGYKTINGYLGVDVNGNTLLNVRELAHSTGAQTAIITTDVITGATPSAFYAHINDRNNTLQIMNQLGRLEKDNLITYALGGVGSKLRSETQNALNKMTTDDGTFFMMVEAALIDKRAHSNDAYGVKSMVERYNDTIAYVVQFVLMHPDTALIITADHECGGIVYQDGEYVFTSTTHTKANVPLFALGYGTEVFNNVATDNTDISKFIAKVYSNEPFGR